jgi:hypothetical protein
MLTSTPSLEKRSSVLGAYLSAITSNTPPAERRLTPRYRLELRVRYRSLSQVAPFSGVGRVVNASRGGVLVVSESEISVGAKVEMLMEWPFRLDGRIPLQLFIIGRVLRRGTSDFVATIERYEFRTSRASSLAAVQSAGGTR